MVARLLVLPPTTAGPPSWEGPNADLDTSLIHGGLLQAPHWTDTFRWWVGTWAGQVPFYRPLTSYVFWFEWKLFGDAEGWYVLPTSLAHLAAALLFTLLAYRVAERYGCKLPAVAALVAGLGFVGAGSGYRAALVSSVYGAWKNQPDSFAAICCFLSLLSYLRARSGARHALGGAIGWYLAACCFKEIAVPLPAACLALEGNFLRSEQRGASLRRVGWMAAAGALFLLIRGLAIGGVGYRYGTNHAWVDRTLLELLGPFGGFWVREGWLGPAVGVWTCVVLFGAWKWWRHPLVTRSVAKGAEARLGLAAILALIGGLGALGSRVAAHSTPPPAHALEQWAAGVIVATGRLELQRAGEVVILILALGTLYPRCKGGLWLGLLWTVTFLAPLTLSPGPSHRYYLTQCGYALLYGIAGGFLAERLVRRFRLGIPRSSKGSVGPAPAIEQEPA